MFLGTIYLDMPLSRLLFELVGRQPHNLAIAHNNKVAIILACALD